MKSTLLTLAVIQILASGILSAESEEIDAVAAGREIFQSIGCAECHTVEKGDTSVKSGPNLYGLFLTEPRQRKVLINEKETSVKADREYFNTSLRKSWDAMAIAEHGPLKGKAFQPLMPMYVKELISDEGVDSLWHFLRTLADEGERGALEVMVTRTKTPEASNVLEIPGEEVVADRTRVMRAPIKGTSARSLHIGQPNGMSYTFDPRALSVRKIWTGGYLNLKEERTARGNQLSSLGKGAQIRFEGSALLAPLTASGKAVDFGFKEPDAYDLEEITRNLLDEKNFSKKLAELDASFLGHHVETSTSAPSFTFKVGQNTFIETISIDDTGTVTITLDAELRTEQRFQTPAKGLSDITTNGGSLENGIWILPADAKGPFTMSAKLPGGVVARDPIKTGENWTPQKLVTRPAAEGRRPLEIPAGYTVEDWLPPTDIFGRAQVFEAMGIAVAKDGTIVLTTRAAGIWRIRDGKWSLFAEGTYEALGVVIEDDKGDTIVIAQKPELTRITDTDGDGRADQFVTVCDDFGFHGNYHEYTHGPVRDSEGNYYFLLNLAHYHDIPEVSWTAGGKFMGSPGGYRGWACRVTPDGKFEPYAMGLRSPAGIAIAPDGRIWYAENQGEYVGSSKLVPLEQGKFYGHISSLISLPGMSIDSPEIAYDLWKDKLRKGAVWLPHGRMANSPGSPAWDLTDGKFGPFKGQIFVGDQTLSTLMRVSTEQVEGQDQGCVIPFAAGLASGIMRPYFLPDGSLLLGQTGRGWGARGGSVAALQRVIYDGKTVPADIMDVSAAKDGYTIRFTRPIAEGVTQEDINTRVAVESWFYTNLSDYGSPEHDKRNESIAAVKISDDRLSLHVQITGFGQEENWLDRIYHLQINSAPSIFGETPTPKNLEAYYTLRAIPQDH